MKRLLAAIALVMAFGACTPHEYVGIVFGDQADTAWGVVAGNGRCPNGESGGDPSAVSPGGGNHGLFQINSVHRAQFESYTGQHWSTAVYDPFFNSVYAKHLVDTQGWRPWSCRP